MSFGKPSESNNPFSALLMESVSSPEAEVDYFSFRRALFKRYDVVHLHWPEYLLTGRSRPVAAIRSTLALLFLARLKASRTAVVATVHNQTPHVPGNKFRNWYLKQLDELVLVRIYLNESDENNMESGVTILHGEYQSIPGNSTTSVPERYVLYFGLIKPYKGIETLITAFSELDDKDVHLIVAGKASDPAYLTELDRLCQMTSRTQLHDGYIPEDELSALLEKSELVVLPYTYMYNSGAVFRALASRSRLLLPLTKATASLQSEFGSHWINYFEGTLKAEELSAALNVSANNPDPLLNMSRRSWITVGNLHTLVYQASRAATANGSRRRARETLMRELSVNSALKEHSTTNRRNWKVS